MHTISTPVDIDIAQVSHGFGAGALAVESLDLHIAPGEFVCILGPAGSGKTTLLKLIAGMIELQQGSIQVAGLAPQKKRLDVACLFARDRLAPWRTALGNVMRARQLRGIAKAERKERALHLLERVGLRDVAGYYPAALAPAKRQRVALARTFAGTAPVVLMDDPFGAFDHDTRLQLSDELLDLWSEEQRTVVFATSDLMEAVALSDRIIVMPAQPDRFVADIPIALARPRWVSKLPHNPVFQRVFSEVHACLQKSGNASRMRGVAGCALLRQRPGN